MARQENRTSPESKPLIQRKYHHCNSIALILPTLVLFLRDATFAGKVVNAGDNIASQSFQPFLDDAKKNDINTGRMIGVVTNGLGWCSLLVVGIISWNTRKTFS